MKTIYCKPGYYKLVDNERDYDFIGYIENFTSATLVMVFESGDYDYDEETDELIWHEDEWELDQLVFAENAGAVANISEYADLNSLEMATVDARDWGGFLADNRGRCVFNALRKALCK